MWKLRPTMLLITVMALALIGCAAVMLAVSGPVARAIGEAIGAGDTALTVWNIARWPVVLVFVVLAVAILYYTTPNIQQPKFRWISGGAALAIVVWILVSEIFGFYVASFSSFNKTYGSLAGAIVLLLWLWITNLALLFCSAQNSIPNSNVDESFKPVSPPKNTYNYHRETHVSRTRTPRRTPRKSNADENCVRHTTSRTTPKDRRVSALTSTPRNARKCR